MGMMTPRKENGIGIWHMENILSREVAELFGTWKIIVDALKKEKNEIIFNLRGKN